jgi:periplasmic protein TonB
MKSVVRDRDPLLELTRASSEERPWLLVALLVATLIHVAIVFAAPRLVRHRERAIEETTEVVDIDIPKPPPAVEEPPKPPQPEEPPQPRAPEPTATTAPPPPPAQAAAVVTRAPDPNEPVDFTGGFVTGAAKTYVGGTTAATGTNPVAVRVPPAATGTPLGTGPITAPPKGGSDRSKRPTLAGDAEWRCPFPAEADGDQIDDAVVTIRVEVGASGAAKSVAVTKDPGHGFGREARRCALDKTWSPALDHDGVAVAGSAVVNVRFDR